MTLLARALRRGSYPVLPTKDKGRIAAALADATYKSGVGTALPDWLASDPITRADVLRVPPDHNSGTGSERNVADLNHFQARKTKPVLDTMRGPFKLPSRRLEE